MDKIPSIPSVPTSIDSSIAAVIRPIREAIIQMTTGDNPVVSVHVLRDLGLISPDSTGTEFKPPPITDMTIPDAPTGLKATGALANIMLTWDAPIAKNVVATEVWAAQTDSFASAQLIGKGDGRIYVDNVGGAAVKYYWIRFVTRSGITGPFNAQAGVRGETSPDPAYLLTLLTGQIRESQLYADLGAKITQIGSLANNLLAEINNRGAADTNLATRIDVMGVTVNKNSADIATESAVRANSDGALAARIDTVQATANNNTAAIQSETTVRASQTGELYGRAGLKIDLNNYITGWGLLSTVNNGVPTSSFAIRADSFYIANPAGPGIAPSQPFVVRTVGSVVGSTYVPPGMYVNQAFIENASISNAKIGIAAVDTANIVDGSINNAKIHDLDATKITAGFIDAARIQAGSIDTKILNVDFAKVTGTLDAAKIVAKSITADKLSVTSLSALSADLGSITSGDIYSAVLHGGTGYPTGAYAWPTNGGTGFHLSANGLLIGNNASGKYIQLTGDGNMYAPGLSIVNGALTISQASVINTLQIAGNAVAVPVGAFAAASSVSVGVYLDADYPVFIQASLTQSVASTISLLRNNVSLWNETPAAGTMASRGILDRPGAGYWTYMVQSSNGANTNGASIFVLVTKR